MSITTSRPKQTESRPPPWYRVPFVWFVIVLLLATLAAAIHLIVISIEAEDTSVLDPAHGQVFKVPALPSETDPDGNRP